MLRSSHLEEINAQVYAAFSSSQRTFAKTRFYFSEKITLNAEGRAKYANLVAHRLLITLYFKAIGSARRDKGKGRSTGLTEEQKQEIR